MPQRSEKLRQGGSPGVCERKAGFHSSSSQEPLQQASKLPSMPCSCRSEQSGTEDCFIGCDGTYNVSFYLVEGRPLERGRQNSPDERPTPMKAKGSGGRGRGAINPEG